MPCVQQSREEIECDISRYVRSKRYTMDLDRGMKNTGTVCIWVSIKGFFPSF